TVAGQVLRVPKCPQAAWRAARADDDPTCAGHGSAPSSHDLPVTVSVLTVYKTTTRPGTEARCGSRRLRLPADPAIGVDLGRERARGGALRPPLGDQDHAGVHHLQAGEHQAGELLRGPD